MTSTAKTTTSVSGFDAADYLETDEDIQEFLRLAMEDGNINHLVHCIGVAARARGMTEVAHKAGLTRASLYKSLHENANPKLDTIARVLNVFGCKLSITTSDKPTTASH